MQKIILWEGMSLLTMNSLYNEKGQWPVPVDWRKNIHAMHCKDNIYHFPKGKFTQFHSLFHSVYCVFSIRLISIADLLAMCYQFCGTLCNKDKCCVVTQPLIIIFRVVANKALQVSHMVDCNSWWYEYLNDRKVLQGKGSREHCTNIVVLVSVIYTLRLHQ